LYLICYLRITHYYFSIVYVNSNWLFHIWGKQQQHDKINKEVLTHVDTSHGSSSKNASSHLDTVHDVMLNNSDTLKTFQSSQIDLPCHSTTDVVCTLNCSPPQLRFKKVNTKTLQTSSTAAVHYTIPIPSK
jgi:hypothetical protein